MGRHAGDPGLGGRNSPSPIPRRRPAGAGRDDRPAGPRGRPSAARGNRRGDRDHRGRASAREKNRPRRASLGRARRTQTLMPVAPEASIGGSRAFENAALASAKGGVRADPPNGPWARRLRRIGTRAAPAATKRRKRWESHRNQRDAALARRCVDLCQSWRISPGYDAGKVATPGGDVSDYTLVESRVAN